MSEKELFFASDGLGQRIVVTQDQLRLEILIVDTYDCTRVTLDLSDAADVETVRSLAAVLAECASRSAPRESKEDR